MSATLFTPEEARALDEAPLWPRLLVFPAAAAGFAMLFLSWPSAHWSVQAGIAAATAYCLMCWTSGFHETAHQTLCSSRRLNVALGKALGTALLVPYTVYRESHIRHHACLNKPTDWELWPYSDPSAPRWFRRAFVWCDLLFGWIVNPCVYGRIYFHRDSPIHSPDLRCTIRREYRAIAIVWLLLASGIGTALFAGVLRPNSWWWLVPIPLSGMLQSARKLTEHLGMPSYDPILGTRTVVGRSWLSRLCTWLNFDIFVHGPHHRYPKIAHHRLRGVIGDYQAARPDRAVPVFPSYRAAIADMLPWLWRNPGVGMNVGAPPPDAASPADCDHFVQDVNRDLLAPSEIAP